MDPQLKNPVQDFKPLVYIAFQVSYLKHSKTSEVASFPYAREAVWPSRGPQREEKVYERPNLYGFN